MQNIKPKSEHLVKKYKKKRIIALTVSDSGLNISPSIHKIAQEIKNNDPAFNIVGFDDFIFKAIDSIEEGSNDIYKGVNVDNHVTYCRMLNLISDNYGKDYILKKFIERTIFNDYIVIPDVKFIEQFGFLKECEVFTVDVKPVKGTNIKHSTIPIDFNLIAGHEMDFTFNIYEDVNKMALKEMMSKFETFYKKKTRTHKKGVSNPFIKVKTKRKRITK